MSEGIHNIERRAREELAEEDFRRLVEEQKDHLRRARMPWWRKVLNFRVTITFSTKGETS